MMSEDSTRMPARFWAKVDRNGPVPEHRPDLGPCWVWTGRKSRLGYGQYGRVWRGMNLAIAHRRHWFAVNGPLPRKTDLDHLCRNRACVRLDHLEPVTHEENCRRGLNGVLRKPLVACKAGHLRSEYGHRDAYQWVCRECHRLRARKAPGPRMNEKTCCPQGHPYDMIGGHGGRACRTCQRAAALAWYHRNKAPKAASSRMATR